MEPWFEAEIDVPISAIEHFSYCPRQCALIHVEQTFDENQYTIRGRLAHERVDKGEESAADGVRILRGIPLWSERYRLRGKADVVELRPEGPYPIEYKVGRPHGVHADLQLCAQALCLEEMLSAEVPRGAIFHHAVRRRTEVVFTDSLRSRTIEMAEDIREMLVAQRLPAAPNDARCPRCSLINACLPSVVGEPHRLRGLQGALFRPLEVGPSDA
ncbi:MAG: CRISPR-associated protein Cas4 [Anaerolinea sp.]|jgi:CRISPR-associated exonuclease Cas4|nr:CRISPR-associated protein Cas4 [Anaerolinea sp.]